MLTADIHMQKTFDDHFSCRNRCGLLHEFLFACFCDEQCLLFGDCCIDYEIFCTHKSLMNISMEDDISFMEILQKVEEQELIKRTIPFSNFQESKLNTSCLKHFGNNQFILNMVVTCQTGGFSRQTKANCEKTEADTLLPYLIHIPVVTKHYLFANIYCAICNGVSERDIINYIPFALNCDNLEEFISVIENKGYKEFILYATNSSKCTFVLPKGELIAHSSVNRFSCSQSFGYSVSTCNSSVLVNNITSSYLCNAYKMTIEVINSNNHIHAIYKNVHCALCNGQPLPFACIHSPPPFVINDPPMFSVLLDAQSSTPTSVFTEFGDLICQKGLIYITNKKICQTPKCRYPEVFLNGSCLYQHDPEEVFAKAPDVYTFVYMRNDCGDFCIKSLYKHLIDEMTEVLH